MDRRTFVGMLSSGIFAVPFAVHAQQAQKSIVLGYLGQGSKSAELSPHASLPTLLKNLRDLGYVEGRNFTVDARFAEGRPEHLRVLAAQLVKANPSVIVVQSAGIARAVLEQ
jgi:hypothetical protein